MTDVPVSGRIQPRIDPVVFGTVLFLASEVMFFGSLFSAYFYLRSRAVAWPPSSVHLDVVEPAVATVLLLASSGTLQAAEGASGRGQGRRAVALVAATLALGLVFLGSQLRVWLTDGFGVATHSYGSMVYTMTGFHGLHVAAGLVLMATMLPAFRSAGAGERRGGIVATVYYWHFVDVVWLGLFAVIYLVR